MPYISETDLSNLQQKIDILEEKLSKAPQFILQDQESDEMLLGKIVSNPHGLDIYLNGYEPAQEEDGAIIYLELYEGKVQIRLWNDVNEQDPVTIDLSKAKKV